MVGTDRMARRWRAAGMGIAGILALPPATMAQSAGPGAVVILSPLKVEGVETSADEARRRLEAVAGGIAVIDGDDLLGSSASRDCYRFVLAAH